MEQSEIWRPVTDVDGLLEVSNQGRVRSVPRTVSYTRVRNGKEQRNLHRLSGKIVKPYLSGRGYLEISIKIGETRPKFLVHRLVGWAFVGGYFDGATIDHLDGDKMNNRADNLEWVTRSENTRRQWESGLVDLRGELHPDAKLTNLQAHAVGVLYQNNFPPSQIAEWFGVSSNWVYMIGTGRRRPTGLPTRYIGEQGVS